MGLVSSRPPQAASHFAAAQSFLRSVPPMHAAFLQFNKGREGYDTSPKRRAPAWTDRVLYKPCGGAVRLLEYDSVQQCKHSDHRPVYAHFTVDVGKPDRVPPLDVPLEMAAQQAAEIASAFRAGPVGKGGEEDGEEEEEEEEDWGSDGEESEGGWGAGKGEGDEGGEGLDDEDTDVDDLFGDESSEG